MPTKSLLAFIIILTSTIAVRHKTLAISIPKTSSQYTSDSKSTASSVDEVAVISGATMTIPIKIQYSSNTAPFTININPEDTLDTIIKNNNLIPLNSKKAFAWLWKGHRLLFSDLFSLTDYGIKSNDALQAIEVSLIHAEVHKMAHEELKDLGETNLLNPLTNIELQWIKLFKSRQTKTNNGPAVVPRLLATPSATAVSRTPPRTPFNPLRFRPTNRILSRGSSLESTLPQVPNGTLNRLEIELNLMTLDVHEPAVSRNNYCKTQLKGRTFALIVSIAGVLIFVMAFVAVYAF